MLKAMFVLFATMAVAWLAPSAASGQAATETRTVQQALSLLGYDVGVVDGKMGPRTMSAVMQYQRERGLLSNGQIRLSNARPHARRSAGG